MVNNFANVLSGAFKDYYALETGLSYVDDKKSTSVEMRLLLYSGKGF